MQQDLAHRVPWRLNKQTRARLEKRAVTKQRMPTFGEEAVKTELKTKDGPKGRIFFLTDTTTMFKSQKRPDEGQD